MKLSNIQFHPYKAALLSIAVAAAVALASSLTIPNSFTAGTTARAAEVNANFAAVKAAVDDNNTRITALETVPAYTAATLGTSWSNVGGAWAVASHTKDPMGFVHLRGLIRRAVGGTNVTIFTLPVGSRPSAVLQFPARCGNDTMCYVHVNPTGNVDFGGAAANDPSTSLTLDGIIFDIR